MNPISTQNLLIILLYPIKEYDAALKDLIDRPNAAQLFAKLRTDRPYRFEFSYLRIPTSIYDAFDVVKKNRTFTTRTIVTFNEHSHNSTL
jgi:hypothetical protein